MQHVTRKLLLICLMLWLPLQGYAATVMPFCAHGQHDQQASHQMHQQMQANPQTNQDAHAGHDQHHGSSNTPCDNCSLCHLCSAMALPSFAAQHPIKPDNFFAVPYQTAFSPIFLEQPQRPPLDLAA